METYTNKYALSIGLGGTYGHKFENVTSKELANWWGIIFRDAALGGSGGAFHRRFREGNSQYDPLIAGCMTERRFLQIKRVIKSNDNDTSPKRGEEGYNPTYKYDMISAITCANTNALSELAGLDLGGDETTFPTNGFGEAGAGVTSRIVGKPGVTKGGQGRSFGGPRPRPAPGVHAPAQVEREAPWRRCDGTQRGFGPARSAPADGAGGGSGRRRAPDFLDLPSDHLGQLLLRGRLDGSPGRGGQVAHHGHGETGPLAKRGPGQVHA